VAILSITAGSSSTCTRPREANSLLRASSTATPMDLRRWESLRPRILPFLSKSVKTRILAYRDESSSARETMSLPVFSLTTFTQGKRERRASSSLAPSTTTASTSLRPFPRASRSSCLSTSPFYRAFIICVCVGRSLEREIVRERMEVLFREAVKALRAGREDLAHRYVERILDLAKKYKVRVPREANYLILRKGRILLLPGRNCTVRLRRGKLVFRIGDRVVKRRPYKGKVKRGNHPKAREEWSR